MDKNDAQVAPAVIKDFIGVMDKLKAIIETENEFLERGLPATLLATTKRKSMLSKEYGALSNEMLDQAAEQLMADPALPVKLVAAGAELQAMSTENRQLLERAIEATRRRVDSVMEAVREAADAMDDDIDPMVSR